MTLEYTRSDTVSKCKIPVYHWVSGHRVHRHCLCGSPAYRGRPDPFSFKWIGGQFKSGLARRNWPSFCSTGGLSLFRIHFYISEGRLHMGVSPYLEHALVDEVEDSCRLPSERCPFGAWWRSAEGKTDNYRQRKKGTAKVLSGSRGRAHCCRVVLERVGIRSWVVFVFRVLTVYCLIPYVGDYNLVAYLSLYSVM